MSARPPLPTGPFLVLGLARSGIAAALTLAARGEQVIGCDAGTPDVSALREAGVAVHLDADGAALVDGAGCVVKSPGVPRTAVAVELALQRGVPVIGELELAWRLLENQFVAITGTNGKTTTTELLGHLHRVADRPVAVAGNVGTAVASLVGALAPDVTVVCEASSFQLEDTLAFAPEGAALLNVTEDHLDRHGTLTAYVDAKLEAFARQEPDDVAVLPDTLDVGVIPGRARRVIVGTSSAAQLVDRDGTLWWEGEPLLAADQIRIRGPHNRSNAMVAAALALARGLEPPAVAEGLRSFAGVAHRLEEIATVDGVLYVNDSKATNVDATLTALRSFDGGVHAILGGRGKGSGYRALREELAARVVAAYLIGEAAEQLAEDLAGCGVPLHRSGDLERAVATARAAASPGETILLSPACTSLDAYVDYAARGDAFRALATA